MTALNFPANPTNGQTYENYVYDGTDGVWKRISPGGTLGNIDDVTIDSPADGESLVYDSATGDWINADATVEVYGVDTAATDYFMIPVGGDADRPVTPANGHIRFNSDSGSPEWYSAANDQWVLFKNVPSFSVEYLVIAGGGAGGGGFSGDNGPGGGGAGGYRSSVTGENSGGGALVETAVVGVSGSSYTVTVGAGGVANFRTPTNGSPSAFHTISSRGGGYGGTAAQNANTQAASGSGGGGWAGYLGGPGTGGQGFAGGSGNTAGDNRGGGGGGASEVGEDRVDGGDGGGGVASSITGSSVTRAGGGGSGAYQTVGGLGGAGGGGDGGQTASLDDGNPGDSNTGAGGGGARTTSASVNGGNGGSGIVIIKYPSSVTATPTVGLTSTTSTVGDYKVTQFTAGTGTVTFS